MRIVQLMTDRSRYFNPSKNYCFSFNAFLISLIGLYFRCLSFRVVLVRDRPFNLKGGLWFFVSFRIFFSDNTRVRIFIFFVAQSAIFFHQNQNIFFSNIGNQNIFLEKNHNPPPLPPLQVK